MVEKYYSIYKNAHTPIGWVLRFGPATFIAIAFFFSSSQTNEGFLNAAASIGILLINEIFLAAKVNTTRPKLTINDEGVAEEKMIFSARLEFEKANTSFSIANKISHTREGKFLISKIGELEVKKVTITKDELLKQADELTRYVNGTYIAEIDLLTAYIILAENEVKILAEKDLIIEDIINILYWTRKRFRVDDYSKKKLQFVGAGVFDSIVVGWDYEIKKYTRDLTADVFTAKFPPKITGHEKEFEELKIALSKASNTNAILVGEPGVGKTSVVEYLAYQSFMGDIPRPLRHKRVYELFVDRLLSGINTSGELEQRLELLLSDLTHSGQAIIYIRNIENIFGGGGFGFDMSGVLYEYLKGNSVRIIGSTTPASYEMYISQKESLREFVDTISVDEFDDAKTLLLISEKTEDFENKHRVKVLYSALKQSMLLSGVYYPERFNPGRSLDLLDEAITATKLNGKRYIDGDDVIDIVHKKTKVALAAPDDKEKELLLHLEDKMHARVVGQGEAVRAVADAMRRVRSGFENKQRPVAAFLFLGPTGVGKTETAKTLAETYFGDENNMIRIDMSEIQNQGNINRLIGSPKGEYSGNSLTAQVNEKPFSLILLDEFEKADRDILNIFLQIFDEGHVTDAKGNVVSFKNTIIIATSNAGSEYIRETVSLSKETLVDKLLKNNIFSPELLNRFDEIVMFGSLTEDDIRKIASLMLSKSSQKLSQDDIEISFDDKLVDKVAKESFNKEFGARNIRRYITDNVEQFVSKLILEDKVKKGDDIALSVDDSDNIVLK